MIQKLARQLLCIPAQVLRAPFSTADKKPVEPKPTPEASPKEEPQIKRSTEESEEEDIPIEKENRNTIGWWIYRFFFWGSFSLLSYNVYLAYTNNGKVPLAQLPGAVPVFRDAATTIVDSFNNFTEFITQPPSNKLLPDTVHPDFHPKTLVLNLTGTLLKTEYVFGKGQKYMLRPGLQNMLKRLVMKYEIIIFAEEESTFLMNSLNHVDPRHQYIQGILGKESMVWRGGQYIKDLKYLNRDIRKIVVVDRKRQNVKNHPDNVILISDYDGSKQDNELSKLLVLLDKLAGPEVNDVRRIIHDLGDKAVDNYFDKIKQKQKNLEKKSGVFGLFNGNPKARKNESADI